MDLERRELLVWSGAATAAFAGEARAAPQISALGLDATQMGVRTGSNDDQSAALQLAINRAAAARIQLVLPPGIYRASALRLPSGARLVGIRDATRLVFGGGPSLLTAEHAKDVSISNLVLEGGARPLPQNRGLVHFEDTRAMRIVDCAILGSGGHGVRLAEVEGEIVGSTITDAADVAILSSDAHGLSIRRNLIANAGNNGIQLLRGTQGHDGTQVLDNRIEDTRNRSGGSGQYGNAINAHRTGDVMVRGNLVRRCAFSGVRGNSAWNIQIIGNTVHEAGETALYSEFAFEGAVIANNIVDGAQTGVSVTNFNEGGRLAVVQGNIFRNLMALTPNPRPDDLLGIGIYVEADTAVTGNVVESAQAAGIAVGWGGYLRDVAVTGNVVRKAAIGIAVSVVAGARSTLISGNLVTGFERGAIVGMDHARPVTTDLSRDGAKLDPHLTINGNRVG